MGLEVLMGNKISEKFVLKNEGSLVAKMITRTQLLSAID
jgi:hypothetical protein